MQKIKLSELTVEVYKKADDLIPEDRNLLMISMDACKKAYARYSGFEVGAAIRTDKGEIITGSNIENASYPSGICAEHAAVAGTVCNYQASVIESIAVCAKYRNEFTPEPVTPCGKCRQVLMEEEERSGNEIRLILYGSQKIYIITGIAGLLPLHFSSSSFDI